MGDIHLHMRLRILSPRDDLEVVFQVPRYLATIARCFFKCVSEYRCV